MKLIGVDVGGTFTDIVCTDTETGRTIIHKVPTTPDDPSHGVITGVGELCERFGLARGEIDHVLHGTTIATNAILEYNGAVTGMVTSEGYRDILHIGRHQRPQDYGVLMRERVLVGAFFRAVDYVQATRQRAVLAQQFARCLDTVDVAITASSMDPACPGEDAERCEYTYNRQARAPLNLTGNPALAVPTGFASTGLPLSMQIMGKPFDEATVYRVARAYEQATPWTSTHPMLA